MKICMSARCGDSRQPVARFRVADGRKNVWQLLRYRFPAVSSGKLAAVARRHRRAAHGGNRMKPLYWGLDIGGIKCALVTGTEDCRCFRAAPWRRRILPPGKACSSAAGPSAARSASGDRRGAAAGPLDSRNGRILSPPNLPGWDDVPIVEWLKPRGRARLFAKRRECLRAGGMAV